MRDLTSPILIFNGLIVIFLAFLAFRFLHRRSESFFRDDIWEQKQRRQESARIDADIDRLALGEREDLEEEPTEKVFREAKRKSSTQAKTDPMIARPSSPRPESPFNAPRFGGAAHDVLGIHPDADAATVQSAYKHWIKRYHPDRVQHLGPGYVRQATIRTELLNRAKSEMLEKIK